MDTTSGAKKGKKKTVTQEVVTGVAAAMIAVNCLGTAFTASYAKVQMKEADEKYILEVVDNIQSTVDTSMKEYMAIAETLALSTEIISFCKETNKVNTMDKSSRLAEVTREMNQLISNNSSAFDLVAVISSEQDAFITNSGYMTASNETLAGKPYYSALTSRSTVITDPYIDTVTGGMVVTICAPVVDGSNVVGGIIIDLPINFLNSLTSSFGSTGVTWVVDSNNTILSHPTSTLIGQDYSAAGVSGSSLTSELSNPTGQLITYDRSGSSRVGSVGSIPSLGWKLVAGMDETEFYQNSVNLVNVLVGIQLVSISIALVVCGLSVYRKLLPLKELNVNMSEMSKGHLTCNITYSSDNEIGELCANLRTTMTNLAIYIEEIKANLIAFGDGDFTRKSDMVFLGDFREIQTSTEEFRTLITGTLEQLKSTVEQVTIGSDYVATGSQNLAEGSAKQSGSVSSLNTHIKDITTQITDDAKAVLEANATAQNISAQLDSSNAKMDEMMAAMSKINEKSEGITKIIKTIEDVAFQTNILALNAAVEAARAGSAGRGFAVVADEVRTLSGRTDEAVKNTSQLIDETRKAVEDGNAIAADTIEQLKSVTVEIVEFINTLDHIAEASRGQAEAIEKIYDGVNEITDVMHTNSAVSEESAATSEELSSQASVMKTAIEQFKL